MNEPVKALIAVRSGERCEALQALLESIDHISMIYVACDVQTGIALVMAHDLALVLADYELCRAINLRGGTAVVALVEDRGEQARARAAGITHVFIEGTPVSQLITTIEALLENGKGIVSHTNQPEAGRAAASEQAMYRRSQQIDAPFRIKSAAVSLVVILIIGMYFIASVMALLPSTQDVPDGALSLVITTVILIAVVEAALQIALFIGAGRIEDRTTRDDTIAARASRNAYLVMTVGIFATFGSMLVGFTPFRMGSLLLLAFLLAEIVKYASQVVYYRRPA